MKWIIKKQMSYSMASPPREPADKSASDPFAREAAELAAQLDQANSPVPLSVARRRERIEAQARDLAEALYPGHEWAGRRTDGSLSIRLANGERRTIDAAEVKAYLARDPEPSSEGRERNRRDNEVWLRKARAVNGDNAHYSSVAARLRPDRHGTRHRRASRGRSVRVRGSRRGTSTRTRAGPSDEGDPEPADLAPGASWQTTEGEASRAVVAGRYGEAGI